MDRCTETTRTVALRNAWNMRDIGGLHCASGISTVAGKIFRSDNLDRLDETDLQTLRDMDLECMIDLRSPAEVGETGPVALKHFLNIVSIPMAGATWRGEDAQRWRERDGEVAEGMAHTYFELLGENPAAIRMVFEAIAASGHGPLVINCVAGKDRTGIVVALILAIVGLCDSCIAKDYEATTAAAPFVERWMRASDPARWARYSSLPAPYRAAPAAAIVGFLRLVRSCYGSVENALLRSGVAKFQLQNIRRELAYRDH